MSRAIRGVGFAFALLALGWAFMPGEHTDAVLTAAAACFSLYILALDADD